jgi:FkbM family methyltransferase
MEHKLLSYLRKFDFPSVSCSRARKSLSDNTSIPSLTFGTVHKMFTKDIGPSAPCIKYPELYKMLQDYGHDLNPNYRFGLITLNKSFKCKPHYDKKNKGITMIKSLGDYQGGYLCVENNGKVTKIDLRHEPYYFYGSETKHWVEDFIGERYTIVFYTGQYNPPYIRPDTTDAKAFSEMDKGAYTKYFTQQRGEVWCDIGANVGAFTYRNQLNGIETHSYEPEPENYISLLMNSTTPTLCHNSAVVAHSNGPVKLYKSKSEWNHTVCRAVRGRDCIDVPTISFSDATKGCDCVKMDIEGGEFDILDNSDLSGFKKMVIAYHINHDHSRSNLEARLQRIRNFGYYVKTTKYPDVERLDFFPNEIMIYCWVRIKPHISVKLQLTSGKRIARAV